MTDAISQNTTPEPKVNCRICGRVLRNKKWWDIFIGPVCRRKNPEKVSAAMGRLSELQGQEVIAGETPVAQV